MQSNANEQSTILNPLPSSTMTKSSKATKLQRIMLTVQLCTFIWYYASCQVFALKRSVDSRKNLRRLGTPSFTNVFALIKAKQRQSTSFADIFLGNFTSGSRINLSVFANDDFSLLVHTDGEFDLVKFEYNNNEHIENDPPYALSGHLGNHYFRESYLSIPGRKEIICKGYLNLVVISERRIWFDVIDSDFMNKSMPTRAPIIIQKKPSTKPTKKPTILPKRIPTKIPTTPLRPPSRSPVNKPTKNPSRFPTTSPIRPPTMRPISRAPIKKLTRGPTKRPTKIPTKKPSGKPTMAPTRAPVKRPTRQPTLMPRKRPSKIPTVEPRKKPTLKPTKAPYKLPSKIPIKKTTGVPVSTKKPTISPIRRATKQPTKKPVASPTRQPIKVPSKDPLLEGEWHYFGNFTYDGKTPEVCFAMVGRKAVLIGGRGGNRQPRIYDPVTLTWKLGAMQPGRIPLHHFHCVVVSNKVWIVSAWTGDYPRDSTVNYTYVYDPSNDQWETRSALPLERRRGAAAAIAVDKLIYIAFGNQGGHETDNHATAVKYFDVYDTEKDTWTALPDGIYARDHAGGAYINGRICIAGGVDSGSIDWPSVPYTECYNISSRKWTIEAEGLPLRGTASYGTSCDGKLLVLGGDNRTGVSYRFDSFDGTKWTRLADLKGGRHHYGSSLAVDCTCNSIYVANTIGKKQSMEIFHYGNNNDNPLCFL